MTQHRKFKKIDEARYETLKTIISSLPKHQAGANKVYDALGISTATASAIRKSANFADYRATQRAYAEKRDQKKLIEGNRVAFIQQNNSVTSGKSITSGSPVTDWESLNDVLLVINSKLDRIVRAAEAESEIARMLFGDPEQLSELTIQELKKKFNLN